MKKSQRYLRFWKKYGPYALVAGGTGGLGEAFSEALARRGLNLIMIARGKERLEAAAAQIREKYSVDVTAIAADLGDYENIKRLINGLLAEEKPKISVGLMVYNAAFAPIGLFENTGEDHLSLAAAVNVRTPLLLAKLLCTPMIQNRRGGIVLMSSLAGAHGSPKLAAYAATKAFNAILAEGLWKELKPHGVDVIGCCAGAILTPGYEHAKKTKQPPGAMTANAVAEQTLKALGKTPFIVPGAVNKIRHFVLTRILSKKAAVGVMAKNTDSN